MARGESIAERPPIGSVSLGPGHLHKRLKVPSKGADADALTANGESDLPSIKF